MKVLLVHDNQLFSEGLCRLLSGFSQEVVSVRRSSEALEMAGSRVFDVAVVSLVLRNSSLDGLALLQDLRRMCPQLPCLATCAWPGSQEVLDAVRLGADGVLPINATSQDFLRALDVVGRGGSHIPHWVARALLFAPQVEHAEHTPQQLEVVRSVAQGSTNEQIAQQLRISPTTVKRVLRGLFEQYQVNRRTSLVAVARRLFPDDVKPRPEARIRRRGV